MPLRKKTQPASRATSTFSADTQTPTGATPATAATESPTKSDSQPLQLPLDPWTDEEEISLFKGIVRWKPAGVHKHFRMIALSRYLQSRGHNIRDAPHIRTAGIWRKLGTLYDLSAINEREDSIFESDDNTEGSTKESSRPFSLAQGEFGPMMFDRRLASDPASSPSFLDRPSPRAGKRGGRGGRASGRVVRASTVEDTEEEPKATPISTHTRKSVPNTRSAKGKAKPMTSPEPKQIAGRKRKRTRQDKSDVEVEDVTGAEADVDEDAKEDEGPLDDSTTAGSPATGISAVTSKAGKNIRKQQEAQGGTDLRRSSRKK